MPIRASKCLDNGRDLTLMKGKRDKNGNELARQIGVRQGEFTLASSDRLFPVSPQDKYWAAMIKIGRAQTEK